MLQIARCVKNASLRTFIPLASLLACLYECLPLLVCFYTAIEDGSAQVKRDFGVLTGEGAAYKGGMEHLYDDMWVLKGGCPEICADDVCESGSVRRLGPLGPRWATRWRTMVGARLGIYRTSQVGERRGFKKGTYVACKAGILVATENAVLAMRVESAGSVDEDRPTRFGVPESFFLSRPLAMSPSTTRS